MSTSQNKLSTQEHWSNRWSGQEHTPRIKFNPQKPSFRDLHHLFIKTLPQDSSFKFLEVGCYPGRYLWYFGHYFDYQVSGLEYVEWCCEDTRRYLQDADVEGEVIHGDLFTYQPGSEEARWDVVASFGLIEHFKNTVEVIQKHLNLLKPGGYLVLVIPNHQGLYGHMMKMVSYEEYKTHNRMDYEDIRETLNQIGQVVILKGGYYGHIGFWNFSLYQHVKTAGKLPYLLVRSPLWMVEHLGRFLPNSSHLSPTIAIIAQKLKYQEIAGDESKPDESIIRK